MINLLPPQSKAEIRQEENWKLVLILGILVLIFLISLFLILFSIKTSISGEVAAQKILLSQKEKELKSSQLQALEEKIEENNLTFSKLKSFYQQEPNLTAILERTSQALLPQTYLTTFNFNSLPVSEEQKYFAQISLSGFSPTREVLLKLKENLELEEDFKEIHFPPSNWVEPADINFTVNFKIR